MNLFSCLNQEQIVFELEMRRKIMSEKILDLQDKKLYEEALDLWCIKDKDVKWLWDNE